MRVRWTPLLLALLLLAYVSGFLGWVWEWLFVIFVMTAFFVFVQIYSLLH